MQLKLIVAATADKLVIGDGSTMPWHIPEDLKFFKESTQGSVVIMGRKTFESIGEPLPKRINYILSRDPDYRVPGAVVLPNLQSALHRARGAVECGVAKDCFVIGGGEIYREALGSAHEIWMTEVDLDVDHPVTFPKWDSRTFECYATTPGKGDNGYQYRFKRYRRTA